MGYSSWGCKESDTIGRLTLTNAHLCITETLATSWKVRQTQGWTSAQSRELIQDPGRPGGPSRSSAPGTLLTAQRRAAPRPPRLLLPTATPAFLILGSAALHV